MGNYRRNGVTMRNILLLTSKCKHYCAEEEWLIEIRKKSRQKNDGFAEIKKDLIRSLVFKLIEGSNLENTVSHLSRVCIIDIA